MTPEFLLAKLGLPLLRLLLTMAVGLLAANLLEALHWTRFVARLAAPLVRAGHLKEVAGASFSLAFFSPAASNTLLAEAHGRGELSRRELVLANLFNSTPTFLVHLPTLFSLVFAFLGTRAFIYIGLTFAAAFLRTLCTIVAGRLLLPARPQGCPAPQAKDQGPSDWRDVARRTLKRFRKRLWRLVVFTVPIYCLFFAAQQAGWFGAAEAFVARHAGAFSFLNPQSIGIIALHLVAESGAALSAAASLAHSGALSTPEIIMALLVGNIVSSPMRAVRHQFPSYAGFFAPGLALFLVLSNQFFRVASLIIVAAAYYWWAF